MTGVLRRKNWNQTGDYAMQLQSRLERCTYKPKRAKDGQPPTEGGRGKTRSSPRGFEETKALLLPWFWTSSPQNCETINLFKPPKFEVIYHSSHRKLIDLVYNRWYIDPVLASNVPVFQTKYDTWKIIPAAMLLQRKTSCGFKRKGQWAH